jgi:hypothetical protein
MRATRDEATPWRRPNVGGARRRVVRCAGARSRAALSLAVLSLAVLSVPGRGHAQEGPEHEAWEELLTAPRMGSTLTALAVDPRDEARLYVGTSEGVLLTSEDGGATFDERFVTPRAVVERSVGFASTVDAVAAPPGQLGTRTREYSLHADPPFATRPSSRPGFRFSTLFFSLRPDFVSAELGSGTTTAVPALLGTAVAGRARGAEPIVHVMVCPGADFPLLVLTRRSVAASDDEGDTFLEVFATASSRVVAGRCARRGGTTQIFVGTTDGTFVSTDGVTFTSLPTMNGSRGVAAMSMCSDGTLHVASGQRVFSQRTGEADLYSIFSDADPAIPHTNITTLSCGSDGTLAIGSDDGLRLWRDGRLSLGAPEVLEGMRIRDLAWVESRLYAVIATCPIGVRVTRCLETRLLVSPDRGLRWSDTNELARRRAFRGVVPGPRAEALVLTAGALWSSGALEAPERSRDDALSGELRRWAARHRAATPPLDDVVEHVLGRLALDEATIDWMSQVPVTRHLTPLLEVSASVLGRERDRERTTQPSMGTLEESRGELQWSVGVQASWNWGFELPNASTVPDPATGERIALQELRRQIAYVIEDAWRERARLLERLERGVRDPVRGLIAAERVAALGALLETFLDGPLSVVEPGAYEAR